MGVSTITPCHGRVPLIRKLLLTIEQSREAYAGESETILIDSSESPARNQIEALCAEYGAQYLRGPLSVREKRNQGIRAARHDIILFIDSDCEADPDLIAQHAQHFLTFSHISGVLGLVRFRGERSWVWKVLEHTALLDSFSFAEKYPYAMWGPTANLSVRKDVLDKVGLFRTELPFRLGGDDLDLTLRITESGHYIKCNPDALVWHTTETWNHYGAIRERSWRWGRMEYYLFLSHPKLRYYDLPKPIVWILVWLIASIVLAIGTGKLALLAVPFIWAVAYFGIETILQARRKNQTINRYMILARLLQLTYELGSVLQFLRERNFQFLTHRILFSTGQILSEWDTRTANMYAAVLSAVCAFIAAALIRH